MIVWVTVPLGILAIGIFLSLLGAELPSKGRNSAAA